MHIPALAWPLHCVVAAKLSEHTPAFAAQLSAAEHGFVHISQMQLASPHSAELEHFTSQFVFLFAVSLEQPSGNASAAKEMARSAGHLMALPRPASRSARNRK
jgi:hypothetical protein